jgi:N-methylhydantoinase B
VSAKNVDVIEYPRGTALEQTLDPITTRVIAGALESIVLEVGHKLTRMAYSSVIRESEDFGAAILDAQGRQVCECPLSTPLQLGPIPGYVRGINQIFAERGQAWHEGDVIMHNSSFHGASHQPDVALCIPIFHEGELVGYSVTTAHHLDLGALVPGSVGIVDATDAYAEGLQFRAVKLFERGEPNKGIWQLLRDNIRSADMVVGDMEAQIAAARVGARRYVELLAEYGRATVEDACEELMNYSERMLRDRIAELPDGVYRATGYVDGFADDPDPERRLLPVKVAVTIEGDTLTVDLTGTAPQVAEKAINMPLLGTVDIAVYVTLRSILLDQATHEDMPQNSGLVRPIRIVAERGSMANPVFPAATIARFCPGNVVADTLMHALSPICGDRVSAGVGNLKVIAYSGLNGEQYWVYMDISEGAYGGMLERDGIDAMDTLYANTRNNPVEDIEAHYPLRVRRYELRTDHGGAGRWRGGMGTVREIEFLAPGMMNLEGDGNDYAPWGAFGGQNGSPGGVDFVRADGSVESLPSKLQGRRAGAGDVIRTLSPCGGGYGDPLERDPELVLSDLLDGYLGADTARSRYGVVLAGTAVDEQATAALRERLRGADAAEHRPPWASVPSGTVG